MQNKKHHLPHSSPLKMKLHRRNEQEGHLWLFEQICMEVLVLGFDLHLGIQCLACRYSQQGRQGFFQEHKL